MKTAPILLILALTLSPAFSKNGIDVGELAQQRFTRCERATKAARDRCTFGGCGNIEATCYEQRINFISEATETASLSVQANECLDGVSKVKRTVARLNSEISEMELFDGTWMGYEAQTDIALLNFKLVNHAIAQCQLKSRTK